MHSSKGNKTQLSWDLYEATDSYMIPNNLQHTTTVRYNHGKGWYFRFDDNKMSCKYPLDLLNLNGSV